MGDIKKVGGYIGKGAALAAPFLGGPLGIAAGLGGIALSGLGRGHQQQIDQVPGDVKNLRAQFINEMMKGLPGMTNSMFGMSQGSQGMSALDPSLVKPYADLFSAQRGEALGQAKESAGNLTGTGYNNILGTSLAGSLAQEQVTLANLGIQQQQFQMQKQQEFMRTLLGLTGQTAQTGYQPGFLDYLFQGASAAAPFFAGRRGQQQRGGGPGTTPPIVGDNGPNIYGNY